MKFYPVMRSLHPRHPFRIARIERRSVDNVFVLLEQDGCFGFGEASPNEFYGESALNVFERLAGLHDWLKHRSIASQADVFALSEMLQSILSPSKAALCAMDLALWDLLGKLHKQSVCKLLWNEEPQALASSVTLGLGSISETREKLQALSDYPRLKIKLSKDMDASLFGLLEEYPEHLYRFDANASLDLNLCKKIFSQIQSLPVELIEQPLPTDEDQSMIQIRKMGKYDLYCDESCRSLTDLQRLHPYFDGVVIKLVKCGGLSGAYRLWEKAQELKMKTMLGCMLESSALISAGAVLGQKCDVIDLDGAWLLKDDAFDGSQLESGLLHWGKSNGLGVTPKDFFI